MTPQIQILSSNDTGLFSAMVELFEAVFEMKDFSAPPAEHLAAVLADPQFIAIAATDHGAVIGGLTAYVLRQYYDTRSLLYIYDLAVATTHQRRGIGGELIRAINELAAARGFEEVFVQADREDGHAVDFYRKTRPTLEEDVLHFSYMVRR